MSAEQQNLTLLPTPQGQKSLGSSAIPKSTYLYIDVLFACPEIHVKAQVIIHV